jgi:predicted ABC-type ATPase
MIAGPNGSGKTTLVQELMRRGADLGRHINPDEIAAQLAGEGEARDRAAQAEADRRRAACLEAGESFSFETVMSHPSKVEVLAEARARGFATLLYFVATEDPRLNVERVRQRVALGGHSVPEERIVARYHRALALLPAAMAAADRVVLFDNSYRPARNRAVRLRAFYEASRRERRIAPPVPGWAEPVVSAPWPERRSLP